MGIETVRLLQSAGGMSGYLVNGNIIVPKMKKIGITFLKNQTWHK